MKKLALIVGLLVIFLIKPGVTEADCGESTAYGTCPAFPWGRVECDADPDDDGHPICCDSKEECEPYEKTESREVYVARIENLCESDTTGNCIKCFKSDPPQAWTAIGCIPTTPSGFIEKFLGLGIGLAGGIAFLLIVFSGFQMITSTGNPERLNAGKELLTSAISGLILIIFSIFLLRLIGIDILGLPGFTK